MSFYENKTFEKYHHIITNVEYIINMLIV